MLFSFIFLVIWFFFLIILSLEFLQVLRFKFNFNFKFKKKKTNNPTPQPSIGRVATLPLGMTFVIKQIAQRRDPQGRAMALKLTYILKKIECSMPQPLKGKSVTLKLETHCLGNKLLRATTINYESHDVGSRPNLSLFYFLFFFLFFHPLPVSHF